MRLRAPDMGDLRVEFTSYIPSLFHRHRRLGTRIHERQKQADQFLSCSETTAELSVRYGP